MSSGRVSLDLFADAERGRIRGERPAALPARLPRPQQLAELPEAELAELTSLLFNELRRRIQRDGPVGTDLARAIAQFAAVLPSASAKNSPPPPQIAAPGKRQAIKAALKAGVKPTQVARHFGLSPAEVRKVASQAD
jgi:hypothetical protein